MNRALSLFVAAALTAVGCGDIDSKPSEPVPNGGTGTTPGNSSFPSNSSTNNSTTNNRTTNNANTSISGNNGGPTFTPEFLDVHRVVVNYCALAGCHGPNSAGGNFFVPGGTIAQPAELQASLTDAFAVSGNFLVEPGVPETSELYLRLVAQPPLLMPVTGSLPQSEIEVIRAWIDNGAVFTQ
jgi:hypothetical protein